MTNPRGYPSQPDPFGNQPQGYQQQRQGQGYPQTGGQGYQPAQQGYQQDPYGYTDTGPRGYPQQGQQGFGFTQPEPSGATAILAGLLGLLGAAAYGYLLVDRFTNLPSGISIGDLPGGLLAVYGFWLAAAVFLLLGALLTFFRVVAGGVLLIIGGLLGFAILWLAPVLIGEQTGARGQKASIDYSRYLEGLFKFPDFQTSTIVIGMIVSFLVLIFAVLPLTFRYLSYKPYNQQGW